MCSSLGATGEIFRGYFECYVWVLLSLVRRLGDISCIFILLLFYFSVHLSHQRKILFISIFHYNRRMWDEGSDSLNRITLSPFLTAYIVLTPK